MRKMSTQCIPPQLSSIPIPRVDTNSVPSKRAREYAPNASTLYRDSPAPPLRVQLLRSSSERATKRLRLDVCANRSRVESKSGKVPRHPLAVDYSRPIQLVDPRPPRHRQSLARQNRMPLPPDSEIRDWKRLLEEDLRGWVDPVIAKGLGDLMWMQQKRVCGDEGGYSDPFFDHLSRVALLDIRPSSLKGGLREEVMALYGPTPRTNRFTHLGERLVNSSVIELNDDEERDGVFEDVLDLYRSAVEGSVLSMEL